MVNGCTCNCKGQIRPNIIKTKNKTNYRANRRIRLAQYDEILKID